MKGRFPLSSKIFALALLNLVLLVAVFLVFARIQFRLEFGSFLFGPAEDRVLSVARLLALDLQENGPAGRAALLARYARTHGVALYLFLNDGVQLGGPPVDLPAAVKLELRRGQGQDPNHPRQPPPRRDPPPPRHRRPPPEYGEPPPEYREPPPPRRVQSDSRHSVFQVSTTNPNLYWVGARIPVPDDSGRIERGTLFMVSPSLIRTPLFFDFRPWLVVAGAVIVVFVICWLPLIRGLTRSISGMTRAAEQIAEGRFDQHLAENRRDELGQLASAINRMADRLAGFVTGQKRFLGDIAHELCAPIARIQFALGILEQRAEEGQRESVVDLQDEVRQMSGLVGELLSFSKAGMQTEAPPLVSVNLARLTTRAIEREAVSGARVETTVDPGIAVLADEDHLLRAVSNLVRNAIRYAGNAGPISVAARSDGRDVLLTVSDCGPGLPAEELDKVFSPFYRPEKSRSRDSGGAGLGLAIVKSCIEACQGAVQCRNRNPSGLEVEVRLRAANF